MHNRYIILFNVSVFYIKNKQNGSDNHTVLVYSSLSLKAMGINPKPEATKHLFFKYPYVVATSHHQGSKSSLTIQKMTRGLLIENFQL